MWRVAAGTIFDGVVAFALAIAAIVLRDILKGTADRGALALLFPGRTSAFTAAACCSAAPVVRRALIRVVDRVAAGR